MQPAQRTRRPSLTLVITWLLTFSMWIPTFCVPPMEHVLKTELALNYTQASLIFSAPILMIVILAIPAGRFADRWGPQKSAGLGIIIIVVGSLLRSTATDVTSLLVFTFIYGAGLGWTFPTIPKIVSQRAPKEEAGLATGVLTSGILTGGAIALGLTMRLIFPIFGTYQSVFLIWSIPAIVAAGLWWWQIRRQSPPQVATTKTDQPRSMPLSRVLRDRKLWLVAIMLLLHNFFFYTWTGWAPTLLYNKGASVDLAGIITSIIMWVGVPTLFIIPRMSFRMGVRKPFLWVPSIILAASALAALYVDINLSWGLMALVGIAIVTRFSTVLALPVEMMPKEEVGIASGLVLSIGYIGAIIGPLIGGRVLDLTGSLNQAMIILIIVSIATTIIALRLPETGPKGKPSID